MGNPAAIVTRVITIWHGTSASDGGAATHRVRALRMLQATNDFFHNLQDWEWTYTESTPLVAADTVNDNFIALPTDFGKFGMAGFLWDNGRNCALREVSKFQLMRLRLLSRGTSQQLVFSIFGGKLQFPAAVGDRSFTAFYKVRPETLVDDGTEMLVPDKYTESVLIPGTAAGAQELKHDAREIWRGQFKDGVSAALANENPAQKPMKAPMSIPGAW